MATKYLDSTGLTYFWSKIKAWVGNYVKITSSTGKDTITAGTNSIDVYDWAQASTKPSYTQDEISEGTTNKSFTSTEKTKLSGIASGAEVNQNAFSNVKVGTSTIAADGKTDTLELVAGDNVTLTPDTTSDSITIGVTVPEGVAPYTSNPAMDGTASPGSSSNYSRGDHVHPSDTSKVSTSTTVNGHALTGNVTVSKSDIGLGNVTNDAQIPLTQKGAASGVCPLDANTKIDSQYLPSYVDDVIEAYIRSGQTALSSTWLATGSASGTVITPETGKIYVLMNSDSTYAENTQFRWGGTAYVKLNDGGVSSITNSEIDAIVAN